MAKDKKKAKPVKKAVKTAPAKAKKPMAAASLGKKAPAADAKRKAATAPAAKTKAKPDSKAAVKPEKKLGKGPEKAKKKGKAIEEEDDFLPEEAEGGEELPDLSDFEEEEAVVEDESDDLTLTAEEEAALAGAGDEEVILTDAEGRRYCKVKDCDQIASVEGYCRYHYLLLWKKIQVRRKILADGKLERYVEELTSRYPDKFLEMIRRDLKTEKDFLSAIAELEIDESAIDNEFEDEAQSYIDEVRGVAETAGMADEEEF